MNPIDSYVRISHNRHWLSTTSRKNTGITTPKPAVTTTTKKIQKPNVQFNHEILDTFCFHWPDMHSYVLVRVLNDTIAILPVRSRVAFLYFHHAPMPTHPSPKELRKALQPATLLPSKRIHGIFKNWKHTLALDDEDISDDDDEQNTPVDSIKSFPLTTPPSTPKSHSSVTLSDVLSYEPNLKDGWIHAPCTVKDDVNIYDNTIILSTKHTELHLVSRCFTEKMMFMNLVKLNHNNATQLDKDTRQEQEITPNDLIECLQKNAESKIKNINQLKSKLNDAKKDITEYSQELLDLELSVKVLLENTSNSIQYNSLRTALDFVNHQLDDSKKTIYSFNEQVLQLKESVSVNIGFLTGVRQRFEQAKTKVLNPARYPYTSFVGMILITLLAVTYYYYHHSSKVTYLY